MVIVFVSAKLVFDFEIPSRIIECAAAFPLGNFFYFDDHLLPSLRYDFGG